MTPHRFVGCHVHVPMKGLDEKKKMFLIEWQAVEEREITLALTMCSNRGFESRKSHLNFYFAGKIRSQVESVFT